MLTDGEIYFLSEDEAWSVFSGLAGLAKDADPGTGTHACRFGGAVSISASVSTGERGDSSRTSGRRVLEPSECRMFEISPEVSRWQGSVTFETETAVTGGRCALAASSTLYPCSQASKDRDRDRR